MPCTEDYKQAVEHAKAAMDCMVKHGVAPNPATLAVCYGYVSEGDPALIWAIDKALKDDGKLTTKRCEEIHAKFIGNGSEHQSLRSASDQLQASMRQVKNCIGEAERSHGAYGETLIGISGKLEGGGSAEEVAGLVRGILNETRQVIERNKALETRLAQSSREIDTLHNNLQKVRWQAMTDPLTGIANRKHFDDVLHEELKKASEQDSALSLLLCDIDNFRAFKALYGSKIGDEVIKLVAGLLEQLVGSDKTAARYGGEEFAIILPGTELQNGLLLADRIREGLASRKLKNLRTGEHYGEVTMSFGIAKYRCGEPTEQLIHRVNEALYRAKEEERVRVAAEPPFDNAVGVT